MDSKRDYISDTWNIMDVSAILLYLVGFITRFFIIESLFIVSKYELCPIEIYLKRIYFRIFLCLDLIIWYVRILHIFAAYEKLGPKLIMILNTVCIYIYF